MVTLQETNNLASNSTGSSKIDDCTCDSVEKSASQEALAIRLEELEQEDEDGELVTRYEILEGENCLIGKATTVERDGKRLLEYVDSDVVLHNAVVGESFKEALEDAESLVEMLRHYERLERDGKIVCTGNETSPSMVFYEIVLPKGGLPFTTDEELVQLVAEVVSVLD